MVTKDDNIDALAKSMEQTMEMGNLSVAGDIGEVMLDSVMEDGVLKDIPVIGAIVGASKCIKNVSDILFTKKIIAFLYELRDTDVREREEAIQKWESDSQYRIRVGEALLNMINRCDDTQKAKWLSMLFHEMVLKRKMSTLFMRAEKVLSSLSVMDVQAFLSIPKDKYKNMPIKATEPFANSGLYRVEYPRLMIMKDILPESRMHITEVGDWIYKTLNG